MDKPVKIVRNSNAMDLHICWSLHDICQYRCSYCPSCNSNARTSPPSFEIIRDFIDRIYDHYANNLGRTKIQFSFTGGEPTLWKEFHLLCRYITAKGMTLGMTTNGERELDYWNDILPEFDWMNISFHPEFSDPEHVFSLIKLMHDSPTMALPALRLMMIPEKVYWKKCLNLRERMTTELENWAIEYVEIQNDFGPDIKKVTYSKEYSDYFRTHPAFEEHIGRPDLVKPPRHPHSYDVIYQSGLRTFLRTNELINNNWTCFRDWSCNIGIESLFIEKNGDIFKAGCMVDGVLGNVHKPDKIIFPSVATVCPSEQCFCATNIMIGKELKSHS